MHHGRFIYEYESPKTFFRGDFREIMTLEWSYFTFYYPVEKNKGNMNNVVPHLLHILYPCVGTIILICRDNDDPHTLENRHIGWSHQATKTLHADCAGIKRLPGRYRVQPCE